jgi:hypothetical protein
MLLIDSLAEEQIRSAIRRGELDDLVGMGRPLALEDDSVVPDELRVAYRMLKNAGCLPPELTLRNEIRQLQGLLAQVEIDAEQESLRRRLFLLKARLAIQGREVNLLVEESGYREKLLRKMTREDNIKQDNVMAWRDRA